jgi:branched-chain amino acid transport system permease protein
VTDFLNQTVVPGIASGATYGLFALAFVVMYRATGILNFAHGQLVMLMPLSVLVMADKWGVPVVLAFVLGLGFVLAVTVVEERIAIRPFMQGGHALPWILSTLGFSVVLTEVMSIPYQNQAETFPWGISSKYHDVIGLQISAADVTTVIVFVALVLVLMLFDRRTVTGLRLRAVSQDRMGATVLGMAPGRASLITALITGVLAAITGVLLASSQLVDPNIGLSVLFSGFIAAAVGGFDSLPGTLVGGFLVGILGQVASNYVGGNWVQASLFGVLLLVFIVRPYGLFGRLNVRAV